MSAKKFEEQVRESMEELKFSPSKNVWAGVVSELDKRRKRRVALWWIPMGLVLVGSVYFLGQWKVGGNNSIVENEKVGLLQSGNKSTIYSEAEQKRLPSTNNEEKKPNAVPGQKENSTGKISVIGWKEKSGRISTSILNENSISSSVLNTNEKSIPSSVLNTNESTEVYDVEKPLENSSLKFFPEKIISLNEIKSTLPLKEYPLSSVTPSKSILRNWSYGINVATGGSGIYDRNLIRQTDASLSNSSSLLPGNLSSIVYRTAVVEPAVFFALGGFIERPVGKLFNLSAGLNYTRYNTKVNVGAKINQPITIFPGTQDNQDVSYYYSPDPKSTYQMHHTMIEMPVTLRFKYRSVSANAGVSASTLVSSDMLAFDARSGVYYKEKDKLNRFQFGITGGFDVAVLKKATYPLYIGPVVRYQVSDITSRYTDSRHLISVAMQARFYLQR